MEKLVERFSKLPHLEAVILFGSLARDSANERSDIDLLVIFDHPKPESFLQQVTHIIKGVNPHREARPVLTNMKDCDKDFLQNVFR
ncbi:MAG: nucleotidyltransferase domain-containing protein [Candidatus Bathyarchaeia archaeon]